MSNISKEHLKEIYGTIVPTLEQLCEIAKDSNANLDIMVSENGSVSFTSRFYGVDESGKKYVSKNTIEQSDNRFSEGSEVVYFD